MNRYLTAAGIMFIFYMFCKAVGSGESVCYVDSPDAAMCSSDMVRGLNDAGN